jgi:hypothetical protein
MYVCMYHYISDIVYYKYVIIYNYRYMLQLSNILQTGSYGPFSLKICLFKMDGVFPKGKHILSIF